MRGHVGRARVQAVVLGLIFLKYISDTFEGRRLDLNRRVATDGDDLFIREPSALYGVAEGRDLYIMDNVLWLPQEARWETIRGAAKTVDVGRVVDDAMIGVEQENIALKGVLPKECKAALDKQ